MSQYYPDLWIVIKITAENKKLYRVFASWRGAWQLNSGITSARLAGDTWEFDGSSGSRYYCGNSQWGTNSYSGNILSTLIREGSERGISIEVMPSTTDWACLDYDRLQQWLNLGIGT